MFSNCEHISDRMGLWGNSIWKWNCTALIRLHSTGLIDLFYVIIGKAK